MSSSNKLTQVQTPTMADSPDTTNKDMLVGSNHCEMKGTLQSLKADMQDLKSSMDQMEKAITDKIVRSLTKKLDEQLGVMVEGC